MDTKCKIIEGTTCSTKIRSVTITKPKEHTLQCPRCFSYLWAYFLPRGPFPFSLPLFFERYDMTTRYPHQWVRLAVVISKQVSTTTHTHEHRMTKLEKKGRKQPRWRARRAVGFERAGGKGRIALWWGVSRTFTIPKGTVVKRNDHSPAPPDWSLERSCPTPLRLTVILTESCRFSSALSLFATVYVWLTVRSRS